MPYNSRQILSLEVTTAWLSSGEEKQYCWVLHATETGLSSCPCVRASVAHVRLPAHVAFSYTV